MATYSQLWFSQPPESLYFVKQEYEGYPCANSNFLKGVRWSPDGSCMLTASDDNWLRIYDVPQDVLEAPAQQSASDQAADNLGAALRMQEGETVYDAAWYSCMTVTDAVTVCFATTSRAHPIHLWDACSGAIRCTYRAYDDADEVTAAYSLAFTPDGTKLVAGYNKCLRIFDVARPGRDSHKVVTHTKKQQEGLPGILSCISFNSADPSLYAVGSYARAAGVLDARTHELLYVLHGHRGGVTHLAWSRDGNFLYSGARQDGEVLCWDVRYAADVLYRLPRDSGATNQRIQFDIEPSGRHLATGGCSGSVRVFDLTDGSLAREVGVADDTVNGCQFHPYLPLLATASGHRRYPLEPPSDDEGEPPGGAGGANAGVHQSQPGSGGFSNCLRVWRCQYELVALPAADNPAAMEQGAAAAPAEEGSSLVPELLGQVGVDEPML